MITAGQWLPNLARGGRDFMQSLHVTRPFIIRVSDVFASGIKQK